MIFNNFEEFKNNLKKNKRIIGLDVGRKTVGVALSDRDKIIATPKFIIQRKSTVKDLDILVKYINENDICAIVSGIPLNSKETENKSCKYINQFIIELDKRTNLPIIFDNEFLSSFVAEDFLINDMKTKFKDVKNIVDKSAASIILQNILNKL